ncbi:MAG: glycosyltransferase [Desulfovibrio sp.]|nr:glycosyltransferase [Desulfovibrio sp.]
MMGATISILYLTYNRLAYTRMTLPALIENAGMDFALTIVDNGSTDGTVDYLTEFAKRHRKQIKHIYFLDKNMGISIPTNAFWRSSRAEFLGKVDNDTLVPPNWLKRLLEAHEQSPALGVAGGFHFNLKYVDVPALEKRVISVDGVQMIPDAYIGGCCYLFRRSLQRSIGYLAVGPRKTHGWTEYQQEIFRRGYVNGYLYPLLLVEHFDDPLDPRNCSLGAHKATSMTSFAEKGMALDRREILSWYVRDAARVVSGISMKEIFDRRG